MFGEPSVGESPPAAAAVRAAAVAAAKAGIASAAATGFVAVEVAVAGTAAAAAAVAAAGVAAVVVATSVVDCLAVAIGWVVGKAVGFGSFANFHWPSVLQLFSVHPVEPCKMLNVGAVRQQMQERGDSRSMELLHSLTTSSWGNCSAFFHLSFLLHFASYCLCCPSSEVAQVLLSISGLCTPLLGQVYSPPSGLAKLFVPFRQF